MERNTKIMTEITDKLDLPCGVQIKNRICKGAMTEGLADEQNRATSKPECFLRFFAVPKTIGSLFFKIFFV